MDTFLRDLRHGVRMLLRTPAVSAVAVLALALGIGANTAIFSVVHAVLLRPLPVRDASRLAIVQPYNPKMNIPPINSSYSGYARWQREARSFEAMAASWAGTAEVGIDRSTEKAPYWRVSGSFLPTLGVQPVLGRAFTAGEDSPGAPRVAILGYEYWSRRFARDPAIAGRTIRIDQEPFTIVGVMPRGFQLDGKPADVYAPIAQDPADRRQYLPVTAWARVKPGVTFAQAQSELDALSARPEGGPGGWKARVWGVREAMAHEIRLSLLVLLGAVTLVLLIACANIASLLLARSAARRREIAVRAALGAPRRRLIAQLLTESLVLSGLGGVAGLALAGCAMRLVPLLDSERLPNILLATRIDPAVLGFTLLASLGTGVLFGIVPALSAVPSRVQENLQAGGRAGETRARKRLWNTLVVAETALAVVLMIGATLLVRSFFYLRDTAPGFRVDGLVTAAINVPRPRNPVPFYDSLLEQVRAIPGVVSATLATSLPLDGDYRAMSLPLEGFQYSRPQDWPVLWYRAVDEQYFRTLQIPVRRGRVFDARDQRGAPLVAIVNESMARRFWPGQNPLGKHLGPPEREFEIVGVVADVRHQDATKEGLVEVFFSFHQMPERAMSVTVRAARRDALALGPALSRAAAAVDGTVPPPAVKDLAWVAGERLAPKRLTTDVIAVFAGLALVLAAIGIYGVLSFTVAQRTHEIGIRMALGARREEVVRMVVCRAAGLAAAGVALGVIGARSLSRVLSSLLFGVGATDPAAFAGASAALLAVAILAAYVPARRAARVDPVIALRDE